MLYKFDEYMEQFPKRSVSTLKKFENEAKNLHEMTTEEINGVVAKWDACVPTTVSNHKSTIKLYLDWIAEQGVPVTIDVDNVEFPIKTSQFFIYSAEMLHEYWDKFLKSCDRQATRTGENLNRDGYLASYAADILAFYGLNVEQILGLSLSDVQPDGVIGYDLPLSQADIDILLEYKSLTRYSNNKKVDGVQYIRSSGNIDKSTIDRALYYSECEDKDKYLKRLLTVKNIYKLGRYAEMYNLEKNTGEVISSAKRATLPDWFLEKMQMIVNSELQGERITAYKKNYLLYKAERAEYEAKQPVSKPIVTSKPAVKQPETAPVQKQTVQQSTTMPKLTTQRQVIQKPVAEPKLDVVQKIEKEKFNPDFLDDVLKYVEVALDELSRMRVQLLGIKMQIEEYVKK